MRDEIIKEAIKAGIKIRKARKRRPRMTRLFKALRVGEEMICTFTHKQAPYSFARCAKVKIRAEVLRKTRNGVRMRVERIDENGKA